MTTHQVVFNLYPFSEGLLLPSANIVQADASGQLTHVMQKATPATIVPYGIVPTPALERLLDKVAALQPKALEEKFKPTKSKTPPSLNALLSDTLLKSTVEGYIHRNLDELLGEIAAQGYALTLDAERRTLAKDVQVVFAREPLVPYLHFRKTAEGLEYRLQLGTETEQWRLQDHDVQPVTNTEPAWLLVDYVLFRVPGINGNMVKPFRDKDMIRIPPARIRTYFQSFIARAVRRSRIEAEGFAVERADTLRTTRLELFENVLEQRWLLKPVFEYDGAEFLPAEQRDRVTSIDFPEDGADIVVRQVVRNRDLEAERLDSLTALGLEPDGRTMRLPGADRMAEWIDWLIRNRGALEAAGFTLSPPLVDGRTVALVPAAIAVESQVAGDWFDVRGAVEIGSFRFPFRDFVPNLRKGDPVFHLPDGTVFLIPDTWFARYAELAGALEEASDGGLRLLKARFPVLEAAGLAEADGNFPVIDPDQVDFEPSTALQATLRPYQLLGVKWLVGHYRHNFGACLADDMGLGKTLQTIALLLHIKENPAGGVADAAAGSALQMDLFGAWQEAIRPLRALVILPASLVFNWQQELRRFAPSLYVYVHTGPKRHKDSRAIAAHDVVLSTYHTVRQDLDLFSKTEWPVLVLDESQQIKNHTSEVSKVVRSLHAGYRLSLSGTPIENSLADLWTQMDFINPDALGSYPSFKKAFETPIAKHGDAAVRERLFRQVQPFFLRRTKEQVAPDLPPLTEQVFYSEMSAVQRKRYDQVKSAVRNEILKLFDDPQTRFQALQALTRLRQIANHPVLADPEYDGDSGKFDDVLANWDVIRRAGHKVLFFSSFEKHLRLFRQVFEAEGYASAWLTGDTPTSARAAEVRRFQEQADVQAFFMTVKAGGVGLNITAADYVFMLDPWWNPAAEKQAIARAHRIGQTRPVTALRFIARDTIEEKIRQLQEKKTALGEGLFDQGSDVPDMSRDELDFLLT